MLHSLLSSRRNSSATTAFTALPKSYVSFYIRRSVLVRMWARKLAWFMLINITSRTVRCNLLRQWTTEWPEDIWLKSFQMERSIRLQIFSDVRRYEEWGAAPVHCVYFSDFRSSFVLSIFCAFFQSCLYHCFTDSLHPSNCRGSRPISFMVLSTGPLVCARWHSLILESLFGL
jgi:hypothetical protein